MTIAIVTRISIAMKFISISISFNCNKHINTFNMIAGLEFKLVWQKHEIVLFFFLLHIASITSSWKYDYIEIND